MTTVNDLFFSDDCALSTYSEPNMQKTADKLSNTLDSFVLIISIKITERLDQASLTLSQTSKSM